MAINSKKTKKYFEENAARWVADGYNEQGYNYPVGFHRARIVTKYLSKFDNKNLKILDLGCGRGDLTFLLAQIGYDVTGIDQSRAMLDLAEEKRSKLSESIRKRVRFNLESVNELSTDKKFDIVVAMGFIGYFNSDKYIFDIVNKLLKPGGYFLVSCRNELFNITSVGFRTENAIKTKKATKLVKEIIKIHDQSKISIDDANNFAVKIKKITKDLPNRFVCDEKLAQSPSEVLGSYKSGSEFEPRQNTPENFRKIATKCGFEHETYFGVHPHLLDPSMNKLLPPGLFNKLCGSLEAFEHLPISLIWSSVFIGVFKKAQSE